MSNADSSPDTQGDSVYRLTLGRFGAFDTVTWDVSDPYRLLEADSVFDLGEFHRLRQQYQGATAYLSLQRAGDLQLELTTREGKSLVLDFHVTPETAEQLIDLVRQRTQEAQLKESLYIQESMPKAIGDYKVLGLLGRGGMGAVYCGHHPSTPEHLVAIKVLPGAAFNHQGCARRFFQEARLGARLDHPHICRVLDYGQISADFFFVMEYLEGQTVRDIVRSETPYTLNRVCHLARQLFEALKYLSDQQVVHRDIKPSNLMVSKDDRLKILDFGLAKILERETSHQESSINLTGAGEFLGTPFYSPPEQIHSARDVTFRTDLYAAGLVLFELVTRRPPFGNEAIHPKFVLEMVLTEEIKDPREFVPDVPEELAQLIGRLTSKEPERRPDHEHALAVLAKVGQGDAKELVIAPWSGRESEGRQDSFAASPPAGPYTDVRSPDASLSTHDTWKKSPPRELSADTNFQTVPRSVEEASRGRGGDGGRRALTFTFGVGCGIALFVLSILLFAVPMYFAPPLANSQDEFQFEVRYEITLPLLLLLFTLGLGYLVRGFIVRGRAFSAFSELPPDVVVANSASPATIRVIESVEQLRTPNACDLREWLPQDVRGRPKLGNYLLSERLGDASAVNTYLARLEAIEDGGPEYVIRTLPLAFSQLAPDKLKQLLRQRGELVKVSEACPYLARVLGIYREELRAGGAVNTQYYMVEDFVEGRSMELLVEQGFTLDVSVVKRSLHEAVSALLALQQKGLLHNNLHPAKLFVNTDTGQLKICDLSCIANITSQARRPTTVGSIGVDWLGGRSRKRRPYLPMELFLDLESPNALADQFSLGRIFVESLVAKRLGTDGKSPEQSFIFEQAGMEREMVEIRKKSPQLAGVLDRMTRMSSDARYPRLEDILHDLQRVPALVGGPPPLPSRIGVNNQDDPALERQADSTRGKQRSQETIANTESMVSLATNPLYIPDRDRQQLTDFLAGMALGDPSFFPGLVERMPMPEAWRVNFPGFPPQSSPLDNARAFCKVCLRHGRNPKDNRFTLLGTALQVLLPELSFEQMSYVAAFLTRHQLIVSDDFAQRFQVSYQIPFTTLERPPELDSTGPDFTWHGPPNEELQAWIPGSPDLLDVGLLQLAIQNATCICRVETTVGRGTGFLVAPTLVMTCCHVLVGENGGCDQTAVDVAARNTEVSFGLYASPDRSENAGRTFKVLGTKPVVSWSAPNELDYALLQLGPEIRAFDTIRPANVSPAPNPEKGAPLNILQHPLGDSMKLGLCANGVTHIDTDRIQYVTKTERGSSGAPCFNSRWQVVAIHRSEVSHWAGTRREGILMRAIHPRIAEYLRG